MDIAFYVGIVLTQNAVCALLCHLIVVLSGKNIGVNFYGRWGNREIGVIGIL
jgi:hypothetical protein